MYFTVTGGKHPFGLNSIVRCADILMNEVDMDPSEKLGPTGELQNETHRLDTDCKRNLKTFGLLDTGARARNTSRIDMKFTVEVLRHVQVEAEEFIDKPPPGFELVRPANEIPYIFKSARAAMRIES